MMMHIIIQTKIFTHSFLAQGIRELRNTESFYFLIRVPRAWFAPWCVNVHCVGFFFCFGQAKLVAKGEEYLIFKGIV